MSEAVKIPSWHVRAEGSGPLGEPAVADTHVPAVNAVAALAIMMQRTKQLRWSDVRRVEATRSGKA
jgi:hypothetical protein